MAKRSDGKPPAKKGPRKGPKRKEPSGAEKRRRRSVKAALGLPPGARLPAGALAAVKEAAGAPPLEEPSVADDDEPAPTLDFNDALTAGDDAQAVWDEAIRVQRRCMRLSVNAEPKTGAKLERTSRIAANLVKAVDPRRQLEEMGAELRDAHELITSLRGGGHGVQEPPRDPGRPPTTSH